MLKIANRNIEKLLYVFCVFKGVKRHTEDIKEIQVRLGDMRSTVLADRAVGTMLRISEASVLAKISPRHMGQSK